jgi:hypothetical protein
VKRESIGIRIIAYGKIIDLFSADTLRVNQIHFSNLIILLPPFEHHGFGTGVLKSDEDFDGFTYGLVGHIPRIRPKE